MAKILVVDDEVLMQTLFQQRFRRQIREGKYEFFFAENGRIALEKLAVEPEIDMVISDINMPEMDGLTLLTRLHTLNPILKAVIVSAYGDLRNIRTAMNRGAFDFITKPIDFEDLTLTIDKTLDHVQHLKATLQAIKENNILKMYVDLNVLQFMGKKEFENVIMANENIEASVVFIDICGFSAISEDAPPDMVVNMLNTYFDTMVREIIAYEGNIDKFIGDAIMAVFKGADHLRRAIRTSLVLSKKISELPSMGDRQFSPKLSIGIHSGEMISGNIGSASLKRLDYTVIGDTVNIAAHLQDTAQANQILISEKCYEQVKGAFKCEKVGSIVLKNKANPLTVYQVLE
jgi:class 3 adenylate cyclase/AmiR/NasT family two-component response regulator